MKATRISVPPSEIVVLDRLREVDPKAVDMIAESIRRVGLRSPIVVTSRDGHCVLVTGAHRLAALIMLGCEAIEVEVIPDPGPRQCKVLEIVENFARYELSPQERADQFKLYLDLLREESVQICTAAVDSEETVSPRRLDVATVAQASRGLGLDRSKGSRLLRIACASPEVRKATAAAGLRTQAALLEVVKSPDPLAKVAEIARRREMSVPYRDCKVAAKLGIEPAAARAIDDTVIMAEGGLEAFGRTLRRENDQLRVLADTWNTTCAAVQERFVEELEASRFGSFPIILTLDMSVL